MSRPRLWVIAIVAALVLGLVYVIFMLNSGKPPATKPPQDNAQNIDINSTPPKSIIDVVTKYISAREDAVGSDQSSPTSWIARVKSITTTSWFEKLQPDPNPSTSSVPNDYTTAHDNGYIVKAVPSSCNWNLESAQPTTAKVSVYCNLSDITLNKASGAQVPDKQLPFGWTHNGEQIVSTFSLVLQNGSWLIDEDTTGETP